MNEPVLDWAVLPSLIIIPGFALYCAIGVFGPGVFARLGGFWIGAVGGFVFSGVVYDLLTLPFFEALSVLAERFNPFNFATVFAFLIFCAPGGGLIAFQGWLNGRKASE